MAVVKANYIRNRKGANMRAIAKETLGYIERRPGRQKEEMARTFFSWGGELTEEQAMGLIDFAPKGTRFWRFIISPDPKTEDVKKDLNLREITKLVIGCLEKRFHREIEFVAVEHNDHTEKKHIHSIALLRWNERLYVPELMELIETATKGALEQRVGLDQNRAYLQNVRERAKEYAARLHTIHTSHLSQRSAERSIGEAGGRAKHDQSQDRNTQIFSGRARRIRTIRAQRSVCAKSPRHTVVTFQDGKSWCRECDRVLESEREVSPKLLLRREHELGL
jgi:hypothetical protein